jgi:hypothetical protein
VDPESKDGGRKTKNGVNVDRSIFKSSLNNSIGGILSTLDDLGEDVVANEESVFTGSGSAYPYTLADSIGGLLSKLDELDNEVPGAKASGEAAVFLQKETLDSFPLFGDEAGLTDGNDKLSQGPVAPPRSIGKQPRQQQRSKRSASFRTSHVGYSFNPLQRTPSPGLTYNAPEGSHQVFRSYDLELSIPKKRKRSSIIDVNYPLPSLDYENMEPYLLSAKDAPRRRAVFMVEKLHRNVNNRVFSQPSYRRLMTNGTKKVVGIHRGRIGLYLTNQSRSHLHYEEDALKLNSFAGLARRQDVEFNIYPTRSVPNHFQSDGWNLFFLNGSDWNGQVKSMHLPELADSILFPNGSKVPKAGKRGNRGTSVGWTGGQSLSKKNSVIAEPQLIEGSLALAPLFVKMTVLIQQMAGYAGFEKPFSDTSGCLSSRLKFARKIHPNNAVESLSVLALIHDNDYTSTVDWLREHFDKENCPSPNWDWLGAVYEDVFVRSIGRWVTVVVTATSRKSISDCLLREVKIRATAEDLLSRYRKEPLSSRFVTRETLCPEQQPFQEIEIHYEVGVHLSPLIFHVHKCSRLFHVRLGRDMPIALVVELVYAFFCTNNVYRFHLEMVALYQAIEQKGIRVMKEGFILQYLTNLITKYGSLDGVENTRGIREGAVRFQACNGNMLCDSTVLCDLHNVLTVIRSISGVKATFTVFKRIVRDLEKSMQGNGVLCSQKVLYALSFLGVVDRSFLKYCIPGSKKHFQRLQQHRYQFERVDQVQQLVDAIATLGDERGSILSPKAEELVCKLLKPPGSNYKDCAIHGVDQFSASVDQQGNVLVHLLSFLTKRFSILSPIVLDTTERPYYLPQWAQDDVPLTFSGLKVRFGSLKNKEFTVCEKTTPTSRSRMESESLIAQEEDFSYLRVQTLLNKNRTVYLEDPLGLIVDSLGLNRECLGDSIRSGKSNDGCGWLSFINRRIFNGVPLEHPFVQVHKVDKARQPNFDANSNVSLSYKTRDSSVMSLLLHLLFNVRVAYRNHWAMKFLKQTKEFVLLIPGNSEKTYARAIGVVIRVEEKIVLRQFSETSNEVERPIRIGHFMG